MLMNKLQQESTAYHNPGDKTNVNVNVQLIRKDVQPILKDRTEGNISTMSLAR